MVEVYITMPVAKHVMAIENPRSSEKSWLVHVYFIHSSPISFPMASSSDISAELGDLELGCSGGKVAWLSSSPSSKCM